MLYWCRRFAWKYDALPDSENIFKKHVHEDREIKSMALLRGIIQEAITQLSSQASVEVDLELGDDLKIHKVMKWEKFEDINRDVFEKCERKKPRI